MRRFGLLCAGLCLCFPEVVHATTITVSVGQSGSTYTEAEITWINADGVDTQDYLGIIRVSVDGSPVRNAFCVDLFGNISIDTYNTSMAMPTGFQRRVGWLLQNVLPSLSGTTQWAGLQLAIWDIVHDGGDGFSAGRVRSATSHTTMAAVLSNAQNYLTLSAGQSYNVGIVYFPTAIGNGAPQQWLMSRMYSDGFPVPSPEPGTVMLIGAGLASGFAASAGRRRS
jgi:hypothetical protein